MRDESDQKELVLGNKQLLSIFFIVIAMLGVAFTLGYMIGRNTANVSAASMSGAPPQAMPTQSPNQSPTQAPRMADPQTAPVVEHYRGLGRFAEVDGDRAIALIAPAIVAAVERLRI